MKKKVVYILEAMGIVVLMMSCGGKLEEVKPVVKEVNAYVFAAGALEAENTYSLTAMTDGFLVAVDFEEGDALSSGQVIAKISNEEGNINAESARSLNDIARTSLLPSAPTLRQSAQEVESARLKYEVDSVQWKRYEQLVQLGSVSVAEYENIYVQWTTSKKNYRNAKAAFDLAEENARKGYISANATERINATLSNRNNVTVPVAGRVYKKWKNAGDFVRKGDVIATVGDAHRLYAAVNVDEGSIASVQLGQEAWVELNALPERKWKARVSRISPQYDEATQAYPCELQFEDSLAFRLVGSQLQANIVLAQKQTMVVIPRVYYQPDNSVQIDENGARQAVRAKYLGAEWACIEGLDTSTVIYVDRIAAAKSKASEVGQGFNR